MISLELFTGIGGLALGLSKAGYDHAALFEVNKAACRVLRDNQFLIMNNELPLIETDVCDFDFSNLNKHVDLLAAGPPCQPFSSGGKHAGYLDKRNMFPEVIRAVRFLKPRAILIENVSGLLRECFSEYFEYIILQLSFPELPNKTNGNWYDHLSCLRQLKKQKILTETKYDIYYKLINSADFGVPQKRKRIFIVGFRSDLKVEWNFPNPTHSEKTLFWNKYISGEYWEKHDISRKAMNLSKKLKEEILTHYDPSIKPWNTVRDTIFDLPSPKKKSHFINHILIPGARSYKGHIGSAYDEPSKTLKAGVHGVPGGENTLRYSNGKVRYFTVRECARLQTFPDDFHFNESWTSSMRQIGNSVPVSLAEILGKSIHAKLLEAKR